MVVGDPLPPALSDLKLDHIPFMKNTFQYLSFVEHHAFAGQDGIKDLRPTGRPDNLAMITDLTATLRIERGLRADHRDLTAGHNLLDHLAGLFEQCGDG